MTALDAIAALLIVVGGIGAFWAYKRSLSSMESLGEAAAELPPPLDERDRAGVQQEARGDVAELNAIAARLEAGEQLTSAEHARVGELVRDLERIEHKPVA